MYNNAINLYNKLLKIYFNDYNNIRNEKKEDMGKKYDPSNLLLYDINLLNRKNKMKIKKKTKSLPEETIAKGVKLRRKNQMINIYLTCHR